MTFVIFGDAFTFPEGEAATNRVHTYAKGFYENGINIHVICFGSEYDSNGNGSINGIYYYHPFEHRKRNRCFIIRRWQKLIKYFKTIRLINRINKRDKVIIINCWTQLLITQIFVFVLSRYIKAKIIHEHSEHPLRNYQRNFFSRILGEIKSYLGTKLCDGIFCISHYLIDFYKSRRVNIKKLFLVPSTVDTERFKGSYNSPLAFQYILYCGSLAILKDGVNILIESFARISKKYAEINLVLIGKGSSFEEMILKDLVTRLDIEERVFFLGQLSRNEVPVYLTNAKILTLARPTSMVAEAGFPSKHTEYLATGLPVVVTDVGEISLYLRDKENVFLSEPNSIEAFATKLEFVLCHYNFARKVALKGQELTNTVFNYNFQAKRMREFVISL